MKRLGLDRFVAIDLETTGLDPQSERIIEVGAVRFVDGAEADKYTSLIYPRKSLPEEIIRLTGITDADLKDAPYPVEVLPELREFIGDDSIAAHNAPFDITFLKVEFARLGEPFHPHHSAAEIGYDTAVVSRALLPTLESHSLSRLAEYFSITGGQKHRAEDDARRCGLLLLRLVEQLIGLSVRETAMAGRILGPGVMGYMFHSLSEYLSENGAPIEVQPFEGYSHNLLGSFYPEESVDSIPEALEKVFGDGGILSQKLTGYEPRPKQHDMAIDCALSFANEEFLMAEAGTGTGKSFAYLIPAILFSISEKKRVVVSTNTKNLQEQLFSKDLPFLIDNLPFRFQTALLKGRGNYLCLRKWGNLLADPDSELAEEERPQALSLLFWANRTTTGDIAENSGFRADKRYWLWSKLASEAGACGGQKCPHSKNCFLQKARSQALKSHIVVVNHALVLTDIAAENAVLGEYDYLVIDEAHNLEKAASQHLGLESNIWKIRAFCNRLHRKEGGDSGLLHRLTGDNDLISDLTGAAITEVNRIRSEAGEFFGQITDTAHLSDHSTDPLYSIKKRYGPNDDIIKAGEQPLKRLTEALTVLKNLLQRIWNELYEGEEEDVDASSMGLELAGISDEALRIRDELVNLTGAENPDWVYWWHLPKREGPEILLCSAPLIPAKVLNERLYPLLDSIIFTSATLTVGGLFDYYKCRLGLDLLEDIEVIYKDYGTPFDYQRQAVFGAPVFIPSPKVKVEFNDSLAKIITNLAVKFRRGMLVLFTSYRQLSQIYETIRGDLLKEDIPLLAQGVEGSRSDIMRRFIDKRAVLLGTDSFWEGIDAPGEALEILIVAKLPFDVPTEPLVEARVEKIENEGGNPFLEYSVPEAAIKLRQGIGRLIRSTTDIGAVLICDTRVINARWGEIFRDSLPARIKVMRSMDEMDGMVGEILVKNI
ncbi:MAG: DEAD/DEAH box helicase family protein [candidate division Zixibacteria bacterium]|nr:DEAD/DEAH box helicase family protein [Candidatus Tariuqbacter arcticus]